MSDGYGVRLGLLATAVVGGWGVAFDGRADAANLRVVSYNVAADVDAGTAYGSPSGVPDAAAVRSVFGAIGRYTLAGNAQTPDVISLQELSQASQFAGGATTTATTLAALVADLNAEFPAASFDYARNADGTPAVSNTTASGLAFTGNGPSGLIYNTKTVSVVGFKNVGTASGSGAARTPSRYALRPVGGAASSQFYVYSQHAKSSGGTDNLARRTVEFDAVRSDADALGPDAHILYTGDYNLTGGSSETAYQDLTAAAGTTLASGATAGPGRAYDPLTSTFGGSSSAYTKFYTESATRLSIRFDFQLVSGAALPTSTADGLRLIADSYAAFGHTFYAGGVLTTNDAYLGNIATALDNGTGVSQQVRTYLTQLSDHLPVISDYAIVVPEPGTLAAVGVVTTLALRRRRV